jgi:5-oxopent-3-ene-1,2,5-tricarboxylate decarboxylase/2-hydroxyhepta-2,4-diene-1,7-dioate isomerase
MSNMAMIAGTIYGAALNDREEYAQLAAALEAPPYNKPPHRPVLYIKPRNCLMGDAGIIPLPSDLAHVEAAPSLALLIGRDAARVSAESALDCVAGLCLALDIGEPRGSYYRPPVRQRCRDGFLRLGAMAAFEPAYLRDTIDIAVNDKTVGHWSLNRLVRSAAQLIADVSSFMTLAAGDLLLTGIPHDAPHLEEGDGIVIRTDRLPPLAARVSRGATL